MLCQVTVNSSIYINQILTIQVHFHNTQSLIEQLGCVKNEWVNRTQDVNTDGV